MVVAPSSRACPARNWRFAVVGAGFEEVTLLDAVRLGQAARTCRPTAGVSTGRVLTRGGRTSQNRLSDNIIPFFSDALLALGGL